MKLYVYDYENILYFSPYKIHFDPSTFGLSSFSFREEISTSAQQLEVGWNLPVSSAAAWALAQRWAVRPPSRLGWGPHSFGIPVNWVWHSVTTSRFVAPQSMEGYKPVVSHKLWLYLQVPLTTQRTGTFYFLKSYEAKKLRTVLTDALRGQDTDWWFQTHASFWVIEFQVSPGEHHHFVTRPAVCLPLSPPHRELESKLLMEVQHVYCPL